MRRAGIFVVAAAVLATTTAVTAPPAGAAPVSLTNDWVAATPLGSYNTRLAGEAFSSPAVGDVTGDAAPEVVVGSNSGRLLVYTVGGQLIRSFATDGAPNGVVSSPALADLDGNGKLDIAIGMIPASDAAAGATVAAFRGDGSKLWGRKTCRYPGKPCDIFATPAIGDVNGDGQLDVVITSQDHYVYVLRGNNGTDVPGWPHYLYDTSWSSPAVADLDGDGRAEVVVASDLDGPTCSGNPPLQPCTEGGLIRVYQHDGAETARYNMPGEVPFSSPAIGDLDGNGTQDIVIGAGLYFVNIGRPETAARRLWAFNRNLQPLPGWPVVLGGRTMASPALVDVDGNGSKEVAITAQDGTVSVRNGNGSLRWSRCARDANKSCNSTSLPMNSSPTVADINNDGTQDILAGTEVTLWAFDARNGTPTFQHVMWSPNRRTFAHAAAPTAASVNGTARVFVHMLIDANQNGGRDAGDADGLWSFSSTTNLGPSAWPTFRHDTKRGGSATPLPPPVPIGQTPNGKYVTRSYQDLLGRNPTGSELQLGVNVVAFYGRQAFERNLVYSDEWARKVITDLYRDVIGRNPDSGGLNYWVGRVRNGMAVRDVAIFMYGSPEYYRDQGGTPGGYVDAIYAAILGRPPDPGGRSYWIGEVQRRGTASVAADFYQSIESRRKRVTGLYQTLLRRAPDPAGRDYWAGRLLSEDDLALALNLVTSNEYFDNS